jgi:hypothetical protein
MTDTTKRTSFSVVASDGVVDELELAGKAVADWLETEYKKRIAAQPVNPSLSIDILEGYPEDEVNDRIVAILGERGYHADPVEYNASSGRAGAFWLTPCPPKKRR